MRHSCLQHETRPYSITARCNRIKPPLISKHGRCTKVFGGGWHEIFTVNFQWKEAARDQGQSRTNARNPFSTSFSPPFISPHLQPVSFLFPRIAFSRIFERFLRESVIASHHRFVPLAFHQQTSLGKALQEELEFLGYVCSLRLRRWWWILEGGCLGFSLGGGWQLLGR